MIRYNVRHLLLLTAIISRLIVFLLPLRGFLPPFYYEEFNGVQRRLESMDGLRINDSWQHEDIILEDCGFDVEIGGTSASLTFVDHQDWVGLFDRIDGIRFAGDGHHVFVTRAHLLGAGTDVTGLTDVLKRLGEVQSFCKNATGPEFERYEEYMNEHESFDCWIKIGNPRN